MILTKNSKGKEEGGFVHYYFTFSSTSILISFLILYLWLITAFYLSSTKETKSQGMWKRQIRVHSKDLEPILPLILRCLQARTVETYFPKMSLIFRSKRKAGPHIDTGARAHRHLNTSHSPLILFVWAVGGRMTVRSFVCKVIHAIHSRVFTHLNLTSMWHVQVWGRVNEKINSVLFSYILSCISHGWIHQPVYLLNLPVSSLLSGTRSMFSCLFVVHL